MKFNHSQELFKAGYAIPSLPATTTERTWYFNGKTFKTPNNVPTELVKWNGQELHVYRMPK